MVLAAKPEKRMNMTKLNSEVCELNIETLDNVTGGMAFFGMNCSARQSAAIGSVVNALGSIPIFGDLLAGAATALGRAYCS